MGSQAAEPPSSPAPQPVAEDAGPFPADLRIGKPSELSIPGDQRVRLIHAPERDRRAIIYLHGMCGDPYGADRLARVLVERGTVISLRADVPCGDRPGNKWPKEAAAIQSRIDRVLEAVKQARGGRLEADQILLVGYSQGAHRAELLLAASPERYPRVLLGGPPTAALPENFKPFHSVAVLGGELEDASHMQAGQEALSANGIRSRFFLLPRAGHGDYGPEGPAVVSRALSFLFEKSP